MARGLTVATGNSQPFADGHQGNRAMLFPLITADDTDH
jgi:hypothetical protein